MLGAADRAQSGCAEWPKPNPVTSRNSRHGQNVAARDARYCRAVSLADSRATTQERPNLGATNKGDDLIRGGTEIASDDGAVAMKVQEDSLQMRLATAFD